MSKIYESGEDYLETILMLMENQPDVHAIDVAKKMNLSKPSVSRALKILKENGYVSTDSDMHIHFTEEGERVAKNIYERHRVLTMLLMQLGVSKETAMEDACKIEHDISQESFEKIKNHVVERCRGK